MTYALILTCIKTKIMELNGKIFDCESKNGNLKSHYCQNRKASVYCKVQQTWPLIKFKGVYEQDSIIIIIIFTKTIFTTKEYPSYFTLVDVRLVVEG